MNLQDNHPPMSGQNLRIYPSTNQLSGAVPSSTNLAHHDADPVLTEIRAAMAKASEPSDQVPAHHEDPVLVEIRAKIARHESEGQTALEVPIAEDHEDPVLAEIRAKMAQMVQQPTDPSQHALDSDGNNNLPAPSAISLAQLKKLKPELSKHRPSKTASQIPSRRSMPETKSTHQGNHDKEVTKPNSAGLPESESEIPDELEDFIGIPQEELRPLPPASAVPAKSILKKPSATVQEPNQTQRRLSVQDQTNFNALITKVDNLEEVLASTDHGLIDTSLDAHKQIAENVARKVLEDPPRYAIRALYQEFVPCLRKINKHYHRIAVGTSAEHPSLKHCDARLIFAEEQLARMNDLI